MRAEMIITNAKVLTMDPAQPRAEAVAVAGGSILAVGSRAEVEALAGPGARVVDAGGRTLLPGFVESHLHLVLGGNELTQLQLGGVQGFDALAAAFRAYAAANPGLPLLMAQGAGYDILGRPVTRGDLDRVIADRPIAMMSPDHHTVWANTAALQAAGLLQGAEMPRGHEVVMGADGLASGELLEFEAFSPVLALTGDLAHAAGDRHGRRAGALASMRRNGRRTRSKIAAGLAHCAAHGITSMVNMDGNRYTCVLLAEMEAEGRLTARVKVPFHMKPHMDLAELDRASAMTAEFRGDWVTSGFVKMFMDGVVDSRTAYMLNPYPGTTETGAPCSRRSSSRTSAPRSTAAACRSRCMRLVTGRCGRRSTAMRRRSQRNGARDARHRIEHIELIDRADVPRLGSTGDHRQPAATACAGGDGFPAVRDGGGDCAATAGRTPTSGRALSMRGQHSPMPATGLSPMSA